MRLVDYYEFNWYPMKGDPHGRYNLIVSVCVDPCLSTSLQPLISGYGGSPSTRRHPSSTRLTPSALLPLTAGFNTPTRTRRIYGNPPGGLTMS